VDCSRIWDYAAEGCYRGKGLGCGVFGGSKPRHCTLRGTAAFTRTADQPRASGTGGSGGRHLALQLSMRSIASTLALGNAVLLKPDPRTTVYGDVILAAILDKAAFRSAYVVSALFGRPEPGCSDGAGGGANAAGDVDARQIIGGRRVRGLTMGEAIPQQFVPSLIGQWRTERFRSSVS